MFKKNEEESNDSSNKDKDREYTEKVFRKLIDKLNDLID